MDRALFLTWGIEFGGLEVVLLDWLSGIDYSRVNVVLGCRQPDIFREKLAAKGLKVELFQLNISDDEPFWRAFPVWLRMISSIRPSRIVFLEGVFAQFTSAAILAAWWSTRNPAFLFLGGWGRSLPQQRPWSGKGGLLGGFLQAINEYGLKQTLNHRLRARLLRCTFAASQALKNNLTTSFGYPEDRISVLYHGVNVEQLNASSADHDEFRRAYGIPADATVIVSHGRLAQVKRPDRILKALEILSREHTNLRLLLTAYGPLKDEVERMVADSNSYGRVHFVGFQSDSSALLKASDIYVMASDNEGFGIALVEAMAAGLVCVATNCGGPGEILVNEQDGFLVEPTDEGVLAGLRQAVELSSAERARMAARARKTIEDRFELRSAIHRALTAFAIPTRN